MYKQLIIKNKKQADHKLKSDVDDLEEDADENILNKNNKLDASYVDLMMLEKSERIPLKDV